MKLPHYAGAIYLDTADHTYQRQIVQLAHSLLLSYAISDLYDSQNTSTSPLFINIPFIDLIFLTIILHQGHLNLFLPES